MKVVSIEIVRQIETAVDASLMSYDQMMLNAGKAAGDYLLNRLNITAQTRITLLIGKGNNGGDGLVVAHHLAQHSSAQVRLYMVESRSKDDTNYQAVVSDDLFIALANDDHDYRVLKNLVNSADIVIDALFGIGIRLPLRDTSAKILRTVKQLFTSQHVTYNDVSSIDPTLPHQVSIIPKPFIFALDCPSGINCDTGEADPNTIPADETITFIAAKQGMFLFPAAQYAGKLILSQIGIPDTQPDLIQQQYSVVDSYSVKNRLSARPADGHKGTFGKVFIVAGSQNYIGATALSGESAYRSGAGLVTIGAIRSVIRAIAGHLREPTFVYLPDTEGAVDGSSTQIVSSASQGYDALLLGCGLGQHTATQSFVRQLLTYDNLPPLILDADALNTLSQTPKWWELVSNNTIITPHPGEMARLANVSFNEVNSHRWKIASEKAKEWDVIVVLKGAHTLIASPDGQVSVIPFKSDALATAGTGDLLAGLIAGLRAQGLSAYDSAIVGTYVHALAGIIAIEQVGSSRSVIAGDVLTAIGSAFKQIEGN